MKKIAITELRKNIGQSTMQVIRDNPDLFRLNPITEDTIMEDMMCEGLVMTYPTLRILPIKIPFS